MNVRVIVGWPGQAATGRTLFCALIVAGAAGCNLLPSKKTETTPNADAAETQLQAARQIKAVRLESATSDGQTSWQIEPVASWMPILPGASDEAMPPHIQERLKYAFDLAQRGATYSAQVEFHSVLGLCADELDAKEGGNRRRTALCEGFTALEEVDDFAGGKSVTDGCVDVKRIASSHRTPTLDQGVLQSMDSQAAVQAYFEFAEERIITACQGMPYATLPLYGLGRTSAALGDASKHSALKSMLMHHVALQVNPANSLAANELGVLLAHNGRYRDAEHILRHGAEAHATKEIWQNLAVVCERLGKVDESQAARQRSQAIADPASSKGESPAIEPTLGSERSWATQRASIPVPTTDHVTNAPIQLAEFPAQQGEISQRPRSNHTAWKPAQRSLGNKGTPLIARKASNGSVLESIWK